MIILLYIKLFLIVIMRRFLLKNEFFLMSRLSAVHDLIIGMIWDQWKRLCMLTSCWQVLSEVKWRRVFYVCKRWANSGSECICKEKYGSIHEATRAIRSLHFHTRSGRNAVLASCIEICNTFFLNCGKLIVFWNLNRSFSNCQYYRP